MQSILHPSINHSVNQSMEQSINQSINKFSVNQFSSFDIVFSKKEPVEEEVKNTDTENNVSVDGDNETDTPRRLRRAAARYIHLQWYLF